MNEIPQRDIVEIELSEKERLELEYHMKLRREMITSGMDIARPEDVICLRVLMAANKRKEEDDAKKEQSA